MTCHKCNDTGLIALRASTGRYAGPGPVPDDARGYAEAVCGECGGDWDAPDEGNWFTRLHNSDKGIAERERGWDRGEE